MVNPQRHSPSDKLPPTDTIVATERGEAILMKSGYWLYCNYGGYSAPVWWSEVVTEKEEAKIKEGSA